MNIFKGTYIQTVDSTGRFSLPADLKNQLGNSCTIIKGTGCLWMITSTLTNHIYTELQKIGESNLKSMFNPNLAKIQRHIFSGMTQVTPETDKNYRVSLTSEQRRYANISDKVILCGAGNYVEIWDPVRLDSLNYNIENDEDLFAIAANLFKEQKDTCSNE